MNNIRLRQFWDALHSSYWFLPGLMVVAAIALAFTMLTLDRTVGFEDWSLIYTGGPDGAREVLSAIAGSMVSVAATAFSITIVALQLAAANFGPRLLRNFMQDTGNQIVLGTFIATFIYCLLVLRTIYGEDYNPFVPHLSVTFSIVLAVLSIGVLIYFIHHASTIIQASYVIKSVSQDFHQAIDRLFPERIGISPPPEEEHRESLPENFANQSSPIAASRNGYLQAIDAEKLMKIACKHNLLLYIKTRPGKFVIEDSILLMAYPSKRVNHKLSKEINKAFILNRERTEHQDVEFPVNQLVEIAVRALSPGINDPFTAIRCIDRLGAGFCYLVQRKFPSPYRYDRDRQLRIIAEPVTFESIVDAAFNPIRQYSRSDASVSIRLLEAIAHIADYTINPEYLTVLRRHADMIARGAQEGLPEPQDRQDLQQRYHNVIAALEVV
ncbi:DUF2254 domain-containing protein [Anabaena sp. 4-3]|uniref:DUF2254 domain-containing protein n=1 Tax=Anabaena sp. 4-3 TaxID=1811979 RepID=UPI0008369757|nr:DUF2254 domain-containing protein [Anabaena sp. 4-3]